MRVYFIFDNRWCSINVMLYNLIPNTFFAELMIEFNLSHIITC